MANEFQRLDEALEHWSSLEGAQAEQFHEDSAVAHPPLAGRFSALVKAMGASGPLDNPGQSLSRSSGARRTGDSHFFRERASGSGNCPFVRLENLSLSVLVALAGLAPGCFSLESDGDPEGGAASGEAETDSGPETGDSSGVSSNGPGESAGEAGGSTTVADDTSGGEVESTGEVDPTETGGEETGDIDPTDETGGDETGGDETGGDETGGETGGETGELCMEELGTFEHCLDCDDTCAEGETCSPGGCAAADALGFSEPFAGVGGYPNRLWGFAVEVEEDAWLGSLNFHGVGNGGDIQLALYSDAAGSPSELLALTDALDSYSAGPYSLDVDPVALPAGTYWLMARNDFPSQIGLDFDPDVAAYFPLTAMVLDFDEPVPETIEASFTFPSYPINLWMTVLLPA